MTITHKLEVPGALYDAIEAGRLTTYHVGNAVMPQAGDIFEMIRGGDGLFPPPLTPIPVQQVLGQPDAAPRRSLRRRVTFVLPSQVPGVEAGYCCVCLGSAPIDVTVTVTPRPHVGSGGGAAVAEGRKFTGGYVTEGHAAPVREGTGGTTVFSTPSITVTARGKTMLIGEYAYIAFHEGGGTRPPIEWEKLTLDTQGVWREIAYIIVNHVKAGTNKQTGKPSMSMIERDDLALQCYDIARSYDGVSTPFNHLNEYGKKRWYAVVTSVWSAL